ncbi:baseplate wedge subunit [Sinorhizobium phage phiM9]|uniref:Baseplate wedge n=1 Tax=Sinorhizobium phage phiM9 TaxID=1636182 RepID=A0A0F6TH75_9CAUD|nr:baseplate wedge subunit [Sinorhizobium phage phiM9]AKE44759.1 baseplate wedge [Sinorhizobium phage phiM9]
MASLINQLRVDQANQLIASPSSGLPIYFFYGAMSRWKKHFAILQITQGATTSVKLTMDHDVEVNDEIVFDSVEGMSQINGLKATVLTVVTDTITVDINSSTFSTYTSGGNIAVYEEVVDEVQNIDDIKSKILAMKFVTGDMISHVVRRVDWVSGKTFESFDPTEDMLGKDFYCYSGGSIYLCVDNARDSVSTVQPIGSSRLPQVYPDGYIWKFVQRVDNSDYQKFGSADWLPVRPLKYANVLKGSIQSIKIHNRGTNYSHNDVVRVIGDGENARFAIGRFLANGAILNITPLNRGTGYSWAKAWIEKADTSSGSGAVLEPIINKFDDYVDPVRELLAHTIRIVVEVKGTEDGQIYVGPIRTTGLLRPDVDQVTKFMTSTIDARSVIEVDSNGQNFAVGDEITGLISDTRAVCAGSEETKIFFVEETGRGFIDGEIVSSGVKNAVSSKITRFDASMLDSSNFLLVDNFEPVTRNQDQIDRFIFTISF